VLEQVIQARFTLLANEANLGRALNAAGGAREGIGFRP
jgi:hypothetical protein